MEYLDMLARWQELQVAIKRLQTEERGLREALFSGTFPDPEEGVNKYVLPDGRVVKGTYKLNRSFDGERWQELPAKLQREVVRTKHEFSLSGYRKLSKDDQLRVERVIVAKPGLPSLEVVDAEE